MSSRCFLGTFLGFAIVLMLGTTRCVSPVSIKARRNMNGNIVHTSAGPTTSFSQVCGFLRSEIFCTCGPTGLYASSHQVLCHTLTCLYLQISDHMLNPLLCSQSPELGLLSLARECHKCTGPARLQGVVTARTMLTRDWHRPADSQGNVAGQEETGGHAAEPAISVTLDPSGEPPVPPALGAAVARHVR